METLPTLVYVRQKQTGQAQATHSVARDWFSGRVSTTAYGIHSIVEPGVKCHPNVTESERAERSNPPTALKHV